MEKTGWKVLAILFIILFVLETSFVGYAVHIYNVETENTNICYYDICGEYPDALYQEGVCSCYDYDVLGSLIIVDQEYMD